MSREPLTFEDADAQQQFTCCPYCYAVFKINPLKLKVRSGDVRCGACREVFNAPRHLVRETANGQFVPMTLADSMKQAQSTGSQVSDPELSQAVPEPLPPIDEAQSEPIAAPEESVEAEPREAEGKVQNVVFRNLGKVNLNLGSDENLHEALASSGAVSDDAAAESEPEQDINPKIKLDPLPSESGNDSNRVLEEPTLAPSETTSSLPPVDPNADQWGVMEEPTLASTSIESDLIDVEIEAPSGPVAEEPTLASVEIELDPLTTAQDDQRSAAMEEPALGPVEVELEPLPVSEEDVQDMVLEESTLAASNAEPDLAHSELNDPQPEGLVAPVFTAVEDVTALSVEDNIQDASIHEPSLQGGNRLATDSGSEEIVEQYLDLHIEKNPFDFHREQPDEDDAELGAVATGLPAADDEPDLKPARSSAINMNGVDSYIADRPNPLVGFFWFLVVTGFVVLLGLQVKLYFVDRFAQNEQYRPYLSVFCKLAKCTLPPRQDAYRFTITHTRIDLHPREPGALRITVKLLNQADFAQPYPELQLTLTDRVGRVVGRRTFPSSFYLDQQQTNQLGSSELGTIAFDLAHPHEKAVGFVVDIVRKPA